MNNYNLKHSWVVSVLNPITADEIMKSSHSTIDEIAKHYPQINLNTWRNICMGRSKIYSKFIKVIKEKKKKEEEKEKKPLVLPRKRRIKKVELPKKEIIKEENGLNNSNPIVLNWD